MLLVFLISLSVLFQDHLFLITTGSISGTSIGSTRESFIADFEKKGFTYKLDSIESCIACDEYDSVYYFYYDDNLAFRADPGWEKEDQGTIFRVIIYSHLFHTADGISVGKTIGDLEKVYKDLEFYMDGHTGIHLFTENFSGSFGIEVPPVDRWFELTYDSLGKEQRINEIILLN